MLPEIEATLARVLEVHRGDPWHGFSTTRLLQGVTADQAAAKPGGRVHSIWEIVLHMTAWTNEVAARLAGSEPGDPAEGDWPEVGESGEARWRAATAALHAAQDALAGTAQRVADDRWHRRVGESRDPALGTGTTHLETLEGLALHHAYHAGQIGLLKRWTMEAERTNRAGS
jgi:uncharacterized damage-inducible protein DinB